MAKKIPQRMCVGCQQMFNKRELLRIVRTPEGEIIIDPTGKKSGRGAYLCSNPDCLKTAVKSKRLEKTLKSKVPEEVYENIKEYLHG